MRFLGTRTSVNDVAKHKRTRAKEVKKHMNNGNYGF